jgi:hypothetical protein
LWIPPFDEAEGWGTRELLPRHAKKDAKISFKET